MAPVDPDTRVNPSPNQVNSILEKSGAGRAGVYRSSGQEWTKPNGSGVVLESTGTGVDVTSVVGAIDGVSVTVGVTEGVSVTVGVTEGVTVTAGITEGVTVTAGVVVGVMVITGIDRLVDSGFGGEDSTPPWITTSPS